MWKSVLCAFPRPVYRDGGGSQPAERRKGPLSYCTITVAADRSRQRAGSQRLGLANCEGGPLLGSTASMHRGDSFRGLLTNLPTGSAVISSDRSQLGSTKEPVDRHWRREVRHSIIVLDINPAIAACNDGDEMPKLRLPYEVKAWFRVPREQAEKLVLKFQSGVTFPGLLPEALKSRDAGIHPDPAEGPEAAIWVVFRP
jgi:hypothetical protein